ncbi:CRISPR-associated endoribonuclease Cas6 [Belliella calami]|uniref:CRISPR-associated endoribonuclease Cas6 n=1 Tax=Belliella calami TaxID=2923436 RepID=UPI001F4AE906|nr:CRISPR-associated endoribonuclease Cas6 [Belliella calami]
MIKLKKESKGNKISQAYQYQLSAALENILEQADKNSMKSIYGVKSDTQRFFPFTFSNLNFDYFEEDQEKMELTHFGDIAWLDLRILIDQSTISYLTDLLKGQRISFVYSGEVVDYSLCEINEVPQMVFKDEMVYKTVTPVFLANKTSSGEMEYILPSEEKYAILFKKQLLKRFSSFFPELKKIQKIEDFCPEIKFEPISKIEEKGVIFKDFENEPIALTAYQYEFKLKASPLLQELGYYGGFGTQNALGFGCVAVKISN